AGSARILEREFHWFGNRADRSRAPGRNAAARHVPVRQRIQPDCQHATGEGLERSLFAISSSPLANSEQPIATRRKPCFAHSTPPPPACKRNKPISIPLPTIWPTPAPPASRADAC